MSQKAVVLPTDRCLWPVKRLHADRSVPVAICARCKTEETQLYIHGVPICVKCANRASPNRPPQPPPPSHEPPPQPDSN